MNRHISSLIYKTRFLGYSKLEKEYEEEVLKTKSELNKRIISELNDALKYACINSEYYSNIIPKDFQVNDIIDLSKIKITTKTDIKSNFERIVKIDQIYRKGSTGGSTGKPLKYYMSKKDYLLGLVNLNKGRSLGGYRLGDKSITIAGASLVPTKSSNVNKLIFDYLLNDRHLSSYGISDSDLDKYIEILNRIKPKYLRGYASSIYLLAQHIDKNQKIIKFDINCVFSTSEKLEDGQRKLIERVLKTKVYDHYGLNDGGLSAFECNNHDGFHIDSNRAILEVVDDNGNLIFDQPGRIIATTLHNKAMPFVRYETGDIGVLSSEECACGFNKPLLKQLLGRTTDYLEINGIKIGSPVLTVLMGKVHVDAYKIIQSSNDKVKFLIIPSSDYDKEKEEAFIKESLNLHVSNCRIEIIYVKDITDLEIINKHKFIIREDFD